jgi:C4-dicarboxylate-specific signal transduction histidine kinase
MRNMATKPEMLSEQIVPLSHGRSYMLIGLLILGWVTIAWLSADYYYGHLSNNLYQREAQLATQQAEYIANNIDESLQQLKGIPLVFSRDDATHRVLRRFGLTAAPSALGYEQRKQQWTQDKALNKLNDSLRIAATNLGADVIWIVNAAGDCISSSNADKSDSFVGTNYADREYFRQVRTGLRGHQYAVGRKTNVPGFYYSYAVFETGRFIGAVVVKRNITEFSYWTNQANAFIADANGVIVMAPDKRLEFHAMPNASIAKLSAENRMLQYKRSVLEPLEITPWGNAHFPSAVLIGDNHTPIVLGSRTLPEDAITIFAPRPLDELVRFGSERYVLFFLLAAAGSMLIVATAAILFYLCGIRHLNKELDAKVKRRTQQLLEAQDELVRREKLAVLGQIAGNVGHELRNPLGVMNNAVYFLRTVLSEADATTREYLDIIGDEIAAADHILSDLLDAVRTKPPQPETVEIGELLTEALHACHIPEPVTVHQDIPATCPPVRVDPQQMQQVLRNLISNGIEAMPEGGTLEIRASAAAEGKAVIISIRDEGAGISPEHQARLFQPLFTTKARRIGLGLAVVKNLTEANGGSVAVQSEPGKGSTFIVTLPGQG